MIRVVTFSTDLFFSSGAIGAGAGTGVAVAEETGGEAGADGFGAAATTTAITGAWVLTGASGALTGLAVPT